MRMQIYQVEYNDTQYEDPTGLVRIVVPEGSEFEHTCEVAKRIVASVSMSLGKIVSIVPEKSKIVYSP